MMRQAARALTRFWNDRGRRMAMRAMLGSARRLRQNLAPRRLFSLPHLLVALWVVVLLWGERWVFGSSVERCEWSRWEKWPSGASPHHLVLVADPQLIDPHSYPGRPWPLNPLAMMVTDNYMRRSYNRLLSILQPDSVFFLGDLFDGGREWKTAQGSFKDPEWGPHPASEQKYLKSWNRRYGEKYWLQEYARFGDMFLKPWLEAGQQPGARQNGRKLVASLPGNHDLGFGSEIKLPVRDRFELYFGSGNRVDVVGNHTIVSVDTVSLSAGSSAQRELEQVKKIYEPVDSFLDKVEEAKSKAVQKELRDRRDEPRDLQQAHRVESAESANFDDRPRWEAGDVGPDLPSILLTHVPLYRPQGMPCGPLREHWPPTKPPKGQTGPVFPDDRNSLTVDRGFGYQYRNVLSEQDSVKLISKIGNVVHAFSGDDHDYCEVTHAENQGHVPEITVKSISMAMGVPTPGFLMVSLYNPLDEQGKPLMRTGQPTLQTHLCLLPNQLSTYAKYALLVLLSLALVGVRAFLVPVLRLQRFAIDVPTGSGDGPVLPVYKAKMEDYEDYALPSSGFSASRYGGSGGGHVDDAANGRAALARTGSLSGYGAPKPPRRSHSHHHRAKDSGPRWGWGGAGRTLRIEIRADDAFYDGGKWKVARASTASAKSAFGVVLSELWASAYRIAWMVVLFWVYLAWRG